MREKSLFLAILVVLGFAAIASATWTPPATDEDGYYPDTSVDKDDTEILGWATGYQDYYRSDGQSGYSDPNQALGQAEGTSTAIVSLGEVSPADDTAQPGELTLTFDTPIGNGDGWDIAVFENAFGNSFPSNLFGELGYVEVSTDGETFVRFPNISDIPDVSGAFAFFATGLCYNLAGRQIQGTGDGFDLDDLADEPEVISGDVNLNNINYVKIVDIPGYGDAENGQGGFLDYFGNPIHDNWPTTGSGGFDLDAVGYRYEGSAGPALVSIEIEPSQLFLVPGDVVQLKVLGTYDDDSTAYLTGADWDSDAAIVAAVDADGKVYGMGHGSAVITAEFGGFEDTIDADCGKDLLLLNSLDAPSISLFDTSTDAFLADGGLPNWTSPNVLYVREREAYVVVSGGFDADPEYAVKVFDVKTMELKRSLDLAGIADNPYDIEFLSDSKAYVTGEQSDTVAVIDPQAPSVLSTITLPDQGFNLHPQGMAIADGKLFVACSAWETGIGLMFVIDTATDAVVDTDTSTPGTLDPILFWSGGINAQDVLLAPTGNLYVVLTGDYWSQWAQVDVVAPTDYSQLDTISLGTGASAGNMSLAPNGKVYLGDGMYPYYYSIDGNTDSLLRDSSSPILVPSEGSYALTTRMVFKDGVAYGLNFNDDHLIAFNLADDDGGAKGQPTFVKDLDLSSGTDHPGPIHMAVIEATDDTETPIELIEFVAEADGVDVRLTWSTATERDTAGFRLWRSDSLVGDFERINASIIPSEGDAYSGAEYAYTDAGLESGETYFYKLEDVDLSGRSTFHGPVDVTLEDIEPQIGCGVSPQNGRSADLALLLLVTGGLIVAVKTRTREKKGYRKPKVKTTSKDEVIRKAGPAQTCSPSPTGCSTGE